MLISTRGRDRGPARQRHRPVGNPSNGRNAQRRKSKVVCIPPNQRAIWKTMTEDNAGCHDDMKTLKRRVLDLVQSSPGLTDRELTARLRGPTAPPQAVNQAALSLVSRGLIRRCPRSDRRICNYPSRVLGKATPVVSSPATSIGSNHLSEDDLKRGSSGCPGCRAPCADGAWAASSRGCAGRGRPVTRYGRRSSR